ncbi:23S rRNA (uracil(1939)-C(5))-methyltransferase RlmD [Pyrococcus furiosus DSM 3638]|uniref:23S rRNA (uracil(747)-C(5))-methyltransferase n=3 Tax=Pyrococcus furiosus TaxID=2261 RepID=ARLMC_PYRFU|nr:23S rRNA (uracil(1939)-C(5))-methyltransferase RlmD [Pyrococcus furiosus]Q8U2K7.1 RecName: Full=23S rRNA (uracil(747)-C(5))-methyltransferase; AltName: Full=23S rRNA(m5U747)-methyltransferase [Pyrococcus furiosus DSM 3638]AAL80951.1 putative RNA methyltransferase [Pyrococcus furiosus DSM 3638]AFN03615.1 RNA methyltransferase [Pyrococcus furiosus COM1]QEK78500.1 23S rRNA (uracil(1939)-C(5))-methyltransferase RlmD [Pyrococcus furiosus DSM 3638]
MRGIIEDLSQDGLGVINGIEVPFCYPGDEVRITRTRDRFGRKMASEFSLITPSPLRQRPRCRHYGKCGGCLWQGMKYEEQLKFKKELFRRITGIEAEILGSPRIWEFRNISNFIVSVNGIGLKEFARPKTVVDLKECPVFSNRTPLYIRAMKEFLRESGLKPWNWKEGDVHYLQVREGKFTGEVMVNIIAHRPPEETILEYFPFADSVYWSIKRDKRDDPSGEPIHLGEKEFISEKIFGIKYLLRPGIFFQTNSYALPLLLKAVEGFLDGSKVLDLYSGIGTFSLYLTKKGFNVVGVEINKTAVEVAKLSAELNSLNVEFKAKRAEEENIEGYDALILDPPRKGLGEFAGVVEKKGPENVVYVSCNPKRFILDFKNYLSRSYKVEDAILIDMFPHTPHVEAVIKLRKYS